MDSSAACQDHPEVPAASSCRGCAEGFCFDCVVMVRGVAHCAGCKQMALSPSSGPVAVSKDASDAMKFAVFGLVILSIIFEPVALSKAFKARSELKADPRLVGRGRATAAILIASFGLILMVLNFAAKVG